MAENFYDRLDAVLDGAAEGQKRNDTIDALDALYAEQQKAEVKQLRSELDDQRTLYETAKAIAEQATKWHTDARADAEKLRAELAETAHVLKVTGEKLEAVRGQRDRAEQERDQARAELEAIRTTETDVTWLADGVRRLIKGVNIRTDKDPESARSTIASEVASHINAGILTAFVSSRVVDLSVEHIRKAEAERDRLAEQVKRVRAAHPPEDSLGRWTCGSCLDAREEPQPYPCPTIRALDGESGR